MNRNYLIIGLASLGLIILAFFLQQLTGSSLVWWIVLAVIGVFWALLLSGALNSRNSRDKR